ncbi:MAG: hypothetical protein Cons2KO_30130 [Congregibacter sp.]
MRKAIVDRPYDASSNKPNQFEIEPNQDKLEPVQKPCTRPRDRADQCRNPMQMQYSRSSMGEYETDKREDTVRNITIINLPPAGSHGGGQ